MVNPERHNAVSSRWLLIFLLLAASLSKAEAQVFPTDDTVTEYRHKGTFYHDMFEGRKTANGEIFDQNAFTAAHWKIKLGTYLLVTNENTGLQVIVKVNDRCPKRGVLDLSHRAATAIGIRGSQPVRLRLLPEGYEERCLAQDVMFDSVRSRLNPGPRETLQDVEPSKPVDAETATTPAIPAVTSRQQHQPVKQRDDDCYRIVLGTVTTHSDAYGMIRMLPDIYQDRASVETLAENGELFVYLDLHLHRSKANELCRALKRTFPQAKLTTCP